MTNGPQALFSRRRRAGAVGGGVLAIVLGTLGLWKGRSGSTTHPCPSGEIRIEGRCVSQRLAHGGKIDLNIASADELSQVPGIGPALSQAILAERNRLGRFESFKQLGEVPGIGPAKLQALEASCVIR